MDDLRPELSSIQTNLFDVHCAVAGCHRGGAPESQLDLEAGNSYSSLVDVASVGLPGMIRVYPGRPDSSYLVRKLSGEGIVGERMPLGKQPLPDSLLETIQAWIRAGAPSE